MRTGAAGAAPAAWRRPMARHGPVGDGARRAGRSSVTGRSPSDVRTAGPRTRAVAVPLSGATRQGLRTRRSRRRNGSVRAASRPVRCANPGAAVTGRSRSRPATPGSRTRARESHGLGRVPRCEHSRVERDRSRSVDTVRVLAMDAVEKSGNGHPGTAMSLAPAAYLLFQRVMRHDPSDPGWPGRDRFVLSCGHSSLTLYIQLYLAGYGLELDDLRQLRQWGSLTPGHPEHGHTRRCRDHHRAARPGAGQCGGHGHGGPPRARPVRPGRRPRAPARSTTSSMRSARR